MAAFTSDERSAGSEAHDAGLALLSVLLGVHSNCVLTRVHVYMASDESAGDIADAAMCDCRSEFKEVENHIDSMFQPSDDVGASIQVYAAQSARSLIESARSTARDIAVSAIVSARTDTP